MALLKIYFLDRILFIKRAEDLLPEISSKYIVYDKHTELSEFIHEFDTKHDYKYAIIETTDIEITLQNIISKLKYIEAAGGVVYDSGNRVLIIKRLGKYDLPKGKVEKGESYKHAAIREIEEECGINRLEILRGIEPTYHTYTLRGELILKKTYWFELIHKGNEKPVPQTEEDITEAMWISKNEIGTVLYLCINQRCFYGSDVKLINAFRQSLFRIKLITIFEILIIISNT